MGPATAKHQAPTHRLKFYVRAFIESEQRRAIKGETWQTVFIQACILLRVNKIAQIGF